MQANDFERLKHNLPKSVQQIKISSEKAAGAKLTAEQSPLTASHLQYVLTVHFLVNNHNNPHYIIK